MGFAYTLALFLNLSCAPAPAAQRPVLKPAVPIVASDPARVKQIFSASCVGCHGANKFQVLDIADMKAKGILDGGEASKMYVRITQNPNRMPLGQPPLTGEDTEAILAWLKDGTPPFEPVVIPSETIDYGDEVTCMARDIAAAPSVHDAEDYRYLTFSRYYNEGGQDNLTRAIEGATKLLNSVSFSPHIEQMTPVECKGVKNAIYRLKLEDFNFLAKDWDGFVVNGKYPYFIFYFDRQEFGFFEDQVFQRTGCVKNGPCQTIPFVRGDWFVSKVSASPLYYDALFKGQKVNDIQAFEKFINVDTYEQIFKTYEARRALFRRSGVTNYNRIVDSYDAPWWIGGVKYPTRYWKSFDTLGDKAAEKKNLFAFPFGPLYAWYPTALQLVQDIKDKVFNFDANEAIGQAPNGTLFFWLSDGNGKRIDEALTEIATHRTNSHPYIGSKPFAIVNGSSCFACHTAMNLFKDEGKSYVLASTDFSNAQVDAAKLLFYKDQAEINVHVNQTDAVFATASKAMQVSEVKPVDAREPIFSTSRQYFDDIGVCELGAEMGYSCGDMKIALLHAPELALLLGLGETLNGKVSRANIEYLQADIAKELNIGKQILFKAGPIVVPPVKCKLTIKNQTAYAQRIDKLAFAEKSYGEFWLNVNDSKVFEHESQASVTSCLSYTNGWCVKHTNEVLQKCGSYGIVRGSDGYSYFKLSAK